MLKLSRLLLLLVLAGCGSVTVPNASGPAVPLTTPVSSPLWRMTPGTWIEYELRPMTGTYANGYITIGTLGAILYNLRITHLVLADGRVARVNSYAGVQVDVVPADFTDTLVEGRLDRLLGEVGNFGTHSISPPEPLLALDPVPGEVLDVFSAIGGSTTYHTRYWTHAINVPDLDGFKNATLTGLVELPDEPGSWAYTHVFDGELAEIWYGAVAPDGSVTGYHCRRVAMGVNAPPAGPD